MRDKEVCKSNIGTKIVYPFAKVCPMSQQNIMIQTIYKKCRKSCSSLIWQTGQKRWETDEKEWYGFTKEKKKFNKVLFPELVKENLCLIAKHLTLPVTLHLSSYYYKILIKVNINIKI